MKHVTPAGHVVGQRRLALTRKAKGLRIIATATYRLVSHALALQLETPTTYMTPLNPPCACDTSANARPPPAIGAPWDQCEHETALLHCVLCILGGRHEERIGAEGVSHNRDEPHCPHCMPNSSTEQRSEPAAPRSQGHPRQTIGGLALHSLAERPARRE